MLILLAKDKNISLDLQKSVDLLNSLCKTIRFEPLDAALNLKPQNISIAFDTEKTLLIQKIKSNNYDHVFYFTNRKYDNNYFYYSAEQAIIVSLFGWRHYTTLPLENGLFYFIACVLALNIDDSFRHQNTTGCIYDFLWDKTGVDIGMKMAYLCPNCLVRVKNKLKETPSLTDIFADILSVFDALASVSRWGKSILEFNQSNETLFDWSTFEDEVAQLYRDLEAEVQQNLNLSGFQIDILVAEKTPANQTVRTIVECKLHKNKIGNKVVNDFARVFQTLKAMGKVDKGVIVSYSGFSKDAFLVAKDTQIELVNYRDLKQSTKKASQEILRKQQEVNGLRSSEKRIVEEEEKIERLAQKSPDLFVIMPFSADLEDVYFLGIHEIAKGMNYSCERVDQMQFDGFILEKVYNSLNNAKIIVAELSEQNTNVYYELGYAHALNKPTILLTKDISNAPFDVKGMNHIVYKNIVDLRKQLQMRLSSMIIS